MERNTKPRVLLSAWFLSEKRKWLGEYLDPDHYSVDYVGLGSPMLMGSKRTSPRKWWKFLWLAVRTRFHLLFHRYDVVISAFPQGGFALGLVSLLTFERTPHVIWYFNCGHEYRGLRKRLAKLAYRRVSRFVVYSKYERSVYSRVFGIPEERFVFTHLTGAYIDRSSVPDVSEKYSLPRDYVVALGDSGRDYANFFEAIRHLEIPAVVVAHDYALRNTSPPPTVTILGGIPQQDYLGILAKAKICVLPIKNQETASGQMTLIQSMSLGVPVIATRCVGTEDYIVAGETGEFVEMGDWKDLRNKIKALLSSSESLESMSTCARAYAVKYFFDSCATRVLEEILEEVCRDPSSLEKRSVRE